MGGFGTTEILVIAGALLFMFGGKKIPQLFKGLGEGLKEMKSAFKDVNEPLQDVKKELHSTNPTSPRV